MAAQSNNGTLANTFNDSNTFRNVFLPYLSYTKACNGGVALGPDGCWPLVTNILSGKTPIDAVWLRTLARVALTNGSLLIFDFSSAACDSTYTPKADHCGDINMDINGFKGPNKIGIDMFA